MGGSRGEADHVEQGAAPDRNDVGMPVDVEAVDLRMNFRNVKIGVFCALAPFDHDGRTDKVQFRISGEIGFDLAAQKGLGLSEAFVDDHENGVPFPAFVLQKNFA
jgi:hypothetical protein